MDFNILHNAQNAVNLRYRIADLLIIFYLSLFTRKVKNIKRLSKILFTLKDSKSRKIDVAYDLDKEYRNPLFLSSGLHGVWCGFWWWLCFSTKFLHVFVFFLDTFLGLPRKFLNLKFFSLADRTAFTIYLCIHLNITIRIRIRTIDL